MNWTTGVVASGTTPGLSAKDDFVGDAVDFMNRNMVLSPDGGGSLLLNAGAKYFKLVKQPFKVKVAGRASVRADAYTIVPSSSFDSGNIRAYWCPYADDDFSATTVGDRANFMFTAAMNGCTFGIGSATPDGSRRVAHGNMKSQGASAGAKQNVILRGMGLGDKMVNPGVYMTLSNNPLQVTTFGVRDPATSQWTFHYQVNTVLPGATGWERELIGVFDAA